MSKGNKKAIKKAASFFNENWQGIAALFISFITIIGAGFTIGLNKGQRDCQEERMKLMEKSIDKREQLIEKKEKRINEKIKSYEMFIKSEHITGGQSDDILEETIK